MIIPKFVCVGAIAVVLAVAGCVTTSQNDDTAQTWDEGLFIVKKRLSEEEKARLSRLGFGLDAFEVYSGKLGDPESKAMMSELAKEASASGRKRPAVVFLHGCDGLSPTGLLRKLAERGFAIAAPDSFARSGRPEMCGLGSQGKLHWRLDEADYALRKLQEQEWVDRSRIYLLGQSEGAEAAAYHSGRGFRGVIVHGASCWYGVNVSVGTPMITINYQEEIGMPNSGGQIRVSKCYDGRNHHVISGLGHGLGNSEGQRLIMEFLDSLERQE
jgi:hypothetical protein